MIYASFYSKIATFLFFDIVSILLMNVFDDAIILQVNDSLPFVAIIEKKTMYLVTLILKSNQSISTAKEVTKMSFLLGLIINTRYIQALGQIPINVLFFSSLYTLTVSIVLLSELIICLAADIPVSVSTCDISPCALFKRTINKICRQNVFYITIKNEKKI
jgi:hypothetical protein